MSEITDKIKAYRATGEGWPELLEWLVDHTYVEAKRYDDPQPSASEERDWDNPHVEGSWDEVEEARWSGDLTNEEYREIADRRHAAATSP